MELCKRPGCLRRAQKKRPGYCSRFCKRWQSPQPARAQAAALQPGIATVSTLAQTATVQPRCEAEWPRWKVKSAVNDWPQGFCKICNYRNCRHQAAGAAAAAESPATARTGCDRFTFGRSSHGGVFEAVPRPRCVRESCPNPLLGGDSWCSKACRDQCPSVFRVPTGCPQYVEVCKFFLKKWQPGNWKRRDGSAVDVWPPEIDAVWQLHLPARWRAFEAKRSQIEQMRGKLQLQRWSGKGNSNLRWHGTRIKCHFQGRPCNDPECSACQIIQATKFSLDKVRTSSGSAMFGDGLYFTSYTHTAKGYGLADKTAIPPRNLEHFVSADAGNAIFQCSVALGNADMIAASPDVADHTRYMAPPDFHTFDSRVVNKTTGNDELVVWNEDQVLLMFMITFKGPGKVPKPQPWLHPAFKNRPEGCTVEAGREWSSKLT